MSLNLEIMKYLKYVLIIFISNAVAQDLTGYTFVDKDLVSGVEITNESTLEKTNSDDNGMFVINAKIGHKVKFVHPLIKEKTIKIKDDKVIKVFLKPNSNNISEVVVESSNLQSKALGKSIRPEYIETAFGPIKVRTAGYSSTYLDRERLKSFNGFSLQRALSSRVPTYTNVPGEGVYLGRGETALWDIDGSIFQGEPPLIDLGLVEEVYIIRSLSAITKYGTIANGGIIIVRTLLSSDNLNEAPAKLDEYEIAENEDIISLDNLYNLVEEESIDSDKLRHISLKYQLNGDDKLA